MDKRAELIKIADSHNAKFPQYKGKFNDYILVRVKRNVKTKLGQAFAKDEIAIAEPVAKECDGYGTFRTLYSINNKCLTSISEKHVQVI